MRPLALALATLLLAAPLRAEDACFVSYEYFEEKIPHFDLDACPGRAIVAGESFCRGALQGEALLIYLFRQTPQGPCLASIDRYSMNDFVARFGLSYPKP